MADDWGSDPLVTPEKPKAAVAHDDWGNDKLITPTAKLMASQLEGPDLVREIGKSFTSSVDSLKRHAAEVAGGQTEGGGILSHFAEYPSRAASTLAIPLDIAGAVAAPLTGALHSAIGTPLSYVLPNTNVGFLPAWMTGADPLAKPTASPQDRANSMVDLAMLGARPGAAPAPPGARPVAVQPEAVAPANLNALSPEAGLASPSSINALSPEAMARAAGTVPVPVRPGTPAVRPPALSPEGLAAASAEPAETAPNAAIREIVRRMDQDIKGGGLTAEQILAERAKAPDKPLTLADLAGENVRGLAGNVARAPGEGRQIIKSALEQRDLGAGDRTAGDVRTGISNAGTKYASDQELMRNRSVAAAPLYEEAFSAPIAFNDRLGQFTADPILKAGLAQGVKLQRLEALAEGKPFNWQDYRIKAPAEAKTPGGGNLGSWLEGTDSIEFEGVPNLRTLDAGKRGLDAIVESNRDAITGKLNQYGRAVDQVRKAFVTELDKATAADPANLASSPYNRARAAWAGPSASMDAMNEGRRILLTNPEKIADDIARLSPGDREFYKLGAADRLIEAIAKKGKSADEAKVIIGNDWTQSQIRPLFPDQASFDNFIGRIEAESRMHSTKYELLGGSPTAGRQAEDVNSLFQAIGSALHTGQSAMHGNYFAVARGVSNTVRALGDLRRDPAINAEIARLMFEPMVGGDKPSGSMKLMQNYMAYKNAEAAQAAQRASAQQNFMAQYARQPGGAPVMPPMPPPGPRIP